MIPNLGNMTASLARGGWSWSWDGSSTEEYGVTRQLQTTLIVVLVISLYIWLFEKWGKGKKLPLPPGPRGLPLIGNLLSLEADLHRYFERLAQTYGPIFKLQLGSKLCVVLSSPSLVKEVLRDHDAIFANRDPPIAGLAATYGGNDIVWSQNGPMWRMLRKVFVRDMMSSAVLDASYALREREVRQTVREVYAKVGTPINIGEQMFITILNVVTSMLWGGTIEGQKRASDGAEFRQVVGEIVGLLGKPNVSDIFPVLARFDLQGIVKQLKRLTLWFDGIVDTIIDQRLKGGGANTKTRQINETKDFLGLLLEIMEQKDAKTPLTMMQVKGLLMDIIVGATDTTSTTLEWAIIEMIGNPVIMRNAQAELEEVVGMNKMVQESHCSRLHYLNAVIKETLRLHPAVPLLVPHSPSLSCTVGGYTVPKGAQVFLNAWAMNRDPEAWQDPSDFKPERFLSDTDKCDYSGKCFNYLPFGSGRRMCPGIPLAERMLIYILASLMHSFEWRLPEGNKIDLSETFGIVLKNTTPLIAIPTPRLLNHELYN